MQRRRPQNDDVTPAGCRCDLCPLRHDRVGGPVLDESERSTELVFVGEAPGKNECIEGRPFVGQSGAILNQWLHRHGRSRSDVAITNVMLCRPPLEWKDYEADLRARNVDRTRANKEAKAAGATDAPLALLPDPRDCCRPRLISQLAGARVIVPLGGTALSAIAACDGILKWRGSPLRIRSYDAPPVGAEGAVGAPLPRRIPVQPLIDDVRQEREPGETWVLPTLHPAYTLHEGPGLSMRGVIDHDIDRVFRVLKTDRIQWTEPDFRLAFTSTAAVVATLHEAADHVRATGTWLSVDIETDPRCSSLETPIWMVGLSWGAGTAVVTFFDLVGTSIWAHVPAVMDALRAVLADSTVPKVFHNGPVFDIPILERHGFLVVNADDTLVAHHATQGELPHSLAFVGSLYTDARFWKDAVKDGGKWNPASDEIFARYCARDCLVTWRVWQSLRLDLRGALPGAPGPHIDLSEVYQHGLAIGHRVLRQMHTAGMPFDRATAAAIAARLREREAHCQEKMQGILAPTDYESYMLERSGLAKARDTQRRYVLQSTQFHPGGVWAIRCALEALRIPIAERTATGLVATGQDVLAKAMPYATPEARRFIRFLIGSAEGKAGDVDEMGWRACVKLRTTYLDHPPILETTGRIHADWRMLVVSGRYSTSPNVQNWPSFLRSIIRAPAGRIFVGADYARIEWYVQAVLSGDQRLLALFEAEDPHAVNARMCFGARYDEVDPGTRKRLRRLAKGLVYGLGYGATDQTIWENAVAEWPELKLSDVSYVTRQLRVLYPDWFRWRDALIDEVRLQRYARSPILGRVRHFLGGLSPTEILNWPPQSCTADVANLAALALTDEFERHHQLTGRRVTLINQSHDSLTFECDDDKLEEELDDGKRRCVGGEVRYVLDTLTALMPGPVRVRYNVPGYPVGDVLGPVRFPVDAAYGYVWSEV